MYSILLCVLLFGATVLYMRFRGTSHGHRTERYKFNGRGSCRMFASAPYIETIVCPPAAAGAVQRYYCVPPPSQCRRRNPAFYTANNWSKDTEFMPLTTQQVSLDGFPSNRPLLPSASSASSSSCDRGNIAPASQKYGKADSHVVDEFKALISTHASNLRVHI